MGSGAKVEVVVRGAGAAGVNPVPVPDGVKLLVLVAPDGVAVFAVGAFGAGDAAGAGGVYLGAAGGGEDVAAGGSVWLKRGRAG